MSASFRVFSFCSICQISKPRLIAFSDITLQPLTASWWASQQLRHASNKHYDPKWRKHRAAKVQKISLPDYERKRTFQKLTPEEQRTTQKKQGVAPPRYFQEREIVIASTSSIFEPYVPPEGDGLASLVSGKRAKQEFKLLEMKGKSLLQMRKIKEFDENFTTQEFPKEAQEIYIEAHKLLENIEENEEKLHDLVTEHAFPNMVWRLRKKSFRWKFLESLEPPRVVHVRTTKLIRKDNIYAQVTVRFHSKQTLALYDRFGRLMLGSESLVKDCLEYVVYEKHLSEEYSRWRIHDKIIPDWLPPKHTLMRTAKKPDFTGVPDDFEEKQELEDTDKVKAKGSSSGLQPEMA